MLVKWPLTLAGDSERATRMCLVRSMSLARVEGAPSEIAVEPRSKFCRRAAAGTDNDRGLSAHKGARVQPYSARVRLSIA